MIEELPKGKSIGAMQASLQWISTHTIRFIGAIMITIGDGEGFILIKKGASEAYYFRHGSKVLRGKPAYDFFSTQDFLTFRLQKYNAEEYRRAFALFNGEQGSELAPAPLDEDIPAIFVKPSPETLTSPEPPGTTITKIAEPGDPGAEIEQEPEIVFEEEETTGVPESTDFVPDVRKILESAEENLDFSSSITGMTESDEALEPSGDAAAEPEQAPAEELQTPPAPAPAEGPAATEEPDDTERSIEPAAAPPQVRPIAMEDSEVADLGWILRRNGVIAASVFSDGFSVVALGDADFEAVAAIAEDALRAAGAIARTMDMGPFVQMTLQMEGKNVIIAPYRDSHICFLTSPKTHLGQIRGILQELALRNFQ
jgi:predicted regulator of Ras-like GTPase activity (Roadblock/LC7/MglB family)